MEEYQSNLTHKFCFGDWNEKGIFAILTVLIIVINPCFASGTADNGFSFVKVVDGEDFGGLERVSAEIPKDYVMLNAYPNPFNASTAISYKLQAMSRSTFSTSPVVP